jgi:AraC-like DNA-binding protein
MREYYIENEKQAVRDHGFEFFYAGPLPPRTYGTKYHIHETIEFVYAAQGRLNISIDGQESVLRKGDLALFRSRGIHSIISSDEPESGYYVLKIKPKLILDISPPKVSKNYALRFAVCTSSLRHLWRSEELVGTDILTGINKLIEESKKPDKHSDLSMLIAACSVILGILRADNSDTEDGTDKLVDNVYESLVYIHTHFAEQISAEAVAEKMNLSYSYFSRSFKKMTGKSFKEYLNITRTNRAEQLLVETDKSITEVALECGYNNVSHFIATYKKLKNKTPLSERKEK